MRFLVDADLPGSTSTLIRNHGFEAFDVRTIGMGQADDLDIAAYARKEGLGICSGDFGFANIRNYPPSDYSGIVVFEIPNHWPAAAILHLIDAFLNELSIIGEITGKLVIVTPGRIRIRTAMPPPI